MLAVFFSALIGVCVAGTWNGGAVNFDCSVAVGAVWWGCGSYGLCESGQYSQVDCVNGTVYNRAEQRCTEPATAPYPCGSTPPDCSLYIDSPGHRIPDNQPDTFDNRPACSYYFTCSYGRFLGYQACSEGTVYDEENQRCSQPEVVSPPCGFGPVREGEEEQASQYGQGQGLVGPTGTVDSFGQGSQYGQDGLQSGSQTNTRYGNNNQPQQNSQYGTQNPYTQNSQHGNQGQGKQVSNEVPGPWFRRRYRF
ncbi:uncharacterized protein [Littorina saxatilis]|uniref:Chitin-binding type-2 domain-containing protein n=1 Tax=Littorina saxatilis TaxID=31220 RepID=A0AAN9AJN3_9CAEN